MILLIDYDNLGERLRRHGVREAAVQLLGALGASWTSREHRAICRLYGGWFEKQELTPRAQQLMSDIRETLPWRAPAGGATPRGVLVDAEIARSLWCDRGRDLTYTYRRRSLPPRLTCASAPFQGCTYPQACPIAGVDAFIRNGACPAHTCPVTPTDVLERPEQKLVDSMLIIDLVHLAHTTREQLVVVSADDDMWPGIRFVLLLGTRIVHVIPRRGRSGPDRYRHLATAQYTPIML